MAALKLTLDGEKVDIDLDRVTLGEGRFLKKQFGMESYTALELMDPDPDMLVGVLAVCVKRMHPELDDDEVIKKVEALPNGEYFKQIFKQVEAEQKKAEAKKDPQSAGASVKAPAKASSSGTSRKTPGPQQ